MKYGQKICSLWRSTLALLFLTFYSNLFPDISGSTKNQTCSTITWKVIKMVNRRVAVQVALARTMEGRKENWPEFSILQTFEHGTSFADTAEPSEDFLHYWIMGVFLIFAWPLSFLETSSTGTERGISCIFCKRTPPSAFWMSMAAILLMKERYIWPMLFTRARRWKRTVLIRISEAWIRCHDQQYRYEGRHNDSFLLTVVAFDDKGFP